MADQPKIVTACMIIIGDEILSGRTKDANLAFVAGRLNELGIRLRHARVIPDEEETIVAPVNEVRQAYDYVFTSGGIGPTHDDITASCIAKAFDLPLTLHPRAHKILVDHYGEEFLNEARLRMAHTPEGADLIENPISKAPGFQVENVFVMAGVPEILQSMMASLEHKLSGGDPVRSRSIGARLPEGSVAGPFAELQKAYPDLDMGSYPFYRGGAYGVSLVLRSTDQARLDEAADKLIAIIRDLGAEPVEGELS